MMTLLFTLRDSLRTARGRRLVAQRALVSLLALAMLLVPATCAEAAGPHSIFTDPNAGHRHHHHESGDGDGEQDRPMTQAELEWHVLMDDHGPVVDEQGRERTGTPVKLPAGPDGTRMTDLPSTMAMAAATSPAVLSEQFRLDVPTAEQPAEQEPLAPAITVVSPEAPPPRV